MKPCQRGEKCIWGNANGDKIVCMFAQCVFDESAIARRERTFREIERMMSDSPEKRYDKSPVRQKRRAD